MRICHNSEGIFDSSMGAVTRSAFRTNAFLMMAGKGVISRRGISAIFAKNSSYTEKGKCHRLLGTSYREPDMVLKASRMRTVLKPVTQKRSDENIEVWRV